MSFQEIFIIAIHAVDKFKHMIKQVSIFFLFTTCLSSVYLPFTPHIPLGYMEGIHEVNARFIFPICDNSLTERLSTIALSSLNTANRNNCLNLPF